MWFEPRKLAYGRWPAWLMAITLGSVALMAGTAARKEIAFAAERAEGWGRYRDPNFGMAFDFPAHIFSLKSGEQGDRGVLFSTPDGRARIRVFGFRNKANDTPGSYLRRIANPEQARFSYVRRTRGFFVASGTRDDMIFYRRCNFFRGKRVGCLQLDYPAHEKRAWDKIVTRISLSLAAAAPSAAQVDTKPMEFSIDAQNAKSTIGSNEHTRSSAQPGEKANSTPKRTKFSKTEPSPSAQLNKGDPVAEKARAAIAAMMVNPQSTEFGRMKRAVKNLRDETLDTICGVVKGKTEPGENTRDMPFLYIIHHDEAYLVDGRNQTAEIVYRTLCSESF